MHVLDAKGNKARDQWEKGDIEERTEDAKNDERKEKQRKLL